MKTLLVVPEVIYGYERKHQSEVIGEWLSMLTQEGELRLKLVDKIECTDPECCEPGSSHDWMVEDETVG